MIDEPGPDGFEFPKIPRLHGSGAVVVTRERDFPAWVGNADRLRGLAQEVEYLLTDAYEQKFKTVPHNHEGLASAQKIATESAMRCRVWGVNNRFSREGDLDVILAEVDPYEVEGVILGNFQRGSELPETVIQIRLGPKSDTSELYVRGPDKRWVGGAFDNLANQISRNVPGWSILRSNWVPRTIGGAFGLSAQGLILAQARDPYLSVNWLIGTAFMVGGGVAVGDSLLKSIIGRMFPAFEIIQPGGASRPRRTLAFVFGLLSLILTSIGVLLGIMAL